MRLDVPRDVLDDQQSLKEIPFQNIIITSVARLLTNMSSHSETGATSNSATYSSQASLRSSASRYQSSHTSPSSSSASGQATKKGGRDHVARAEGQGKASAVGGKRKRRNRRGKEKGRRGELKGKKRKTRRRNEIEQEEAEGIRIKEEQDSGQEDNDHFYSEDEKDADTSASDQQEGEEEEEEADSPLGEEEEEVSSQTEMQLEVVMVGYRLPRQKRDVRMFVPLERPTSSGFAAPVTSAVPGAVNQSGETFEELRERVKHIVRQDPHLSKGLKADPAILDEYKIFTGKGGIYYPLTQPWESFRPKGKDIWTIRLEKEDAEDDEDSDSGSDSNDGGSSDDGSSDDDRKKRKKRKEKERRRREKEKERKKKAEQKPQAKDAAEITAPVVAQIPPVANPLLSKSAPVRLTEPIFEKPSPPYAPPPPNPTPTSPTPPSPTSSKPNERPLPGIAPPPEEVSTLVGIPSFAEKTSPLADPTQRIVPRFNRPQPATKKTIEPEQQKKDIQFELPDITPLAPSIQLEKRAPSIQPPYSPPPPPTATPVFQEPPRPVFVQPQYQPLVTSKPQPSITTPTHATTAHPPPAGYASTSSFPASASTSQPTAAAGPRSVAPKFLDAGQGQVYERECGVGINGVKNALQQIFQSKLGPKAIPEYRELPVKSATGHFFSSVDLSRITGGEKIVGYGRAPQKKEAEKLAAMDAYYKYRLFLETNPEMAEQEEEDEVNPTVLLNETFHRLFARSPQFIYSESPGSGFRARLDVNGVLFDAVAPNKSKAAQLVSKRALAYIQEQEAQRRVSTTPTFSTIRINPRYGNG